VFCTNDEWSGEKLKLAKYTPDAELPFETTCGNLFKYCHIVRERGHKQPVFGRSVLLADAVAIHCTNGDIITGYENIVKWDNAIWFVNLSRDG